ncbi:cohesin subunit SA-3 isoform X5 [Haliaeetus albicilla]|uniref:cohesin subunit SA-3 isoform X5 n=1 Tax=Haliaeetus albicilla TaxID=8969 RepID=UPI0037E6FDD1
MPPRRSAHVQGASSSSGSSAGLGTGSSPAPGSAGARSGSSPSPPAPDSPDLSSGDSGSDFEDVLRLHRKRRPRRAQSRGPVSKRPRRREPSGDGSSLAVSNPEQNTLFEAVRSAKIAVETVVDDWLETYKQDRETGFLELVNFIIRSCGCRGVVTLKMFRHLQNSEIIQQLTEKFEEDSAEYPLSLGTQPWRRFRAAFCELVAAVVRQCQYSVVYDEFLMDALISLLTGLSDSQVRAFRHTSTLAAMKLMTALVNVALGVSLHQENNQRQYEAERSKGPGRQATDKLEALLEKRRELQEQQEEIENMMNAIFKGIFVHRYRDVVPEIRAICMEELGTWMKSYTASFLTDGYLKYIGWTLHDKQREVRLQCVKALQGLYCHRDTAAHMELFTSRFKTRMVSMVLDKEPDVAVEVVKLLTLMLENTEEVLTEEDCQSVYPVVYVSSRALASAAGLFLYRRLLDPQRGAGREPSRDGDNRTFFRLLLAFFIESEAWQTGRRRHWWRSWQPAWSRRLRGSPQWAAAWPRSPQPGSARHRRRREPGSPTASSQPCPSCWPSSQLMLRRRLRSWRCCAASTSAYTALGGWRSTWSWCWGSCRRWWRSTRGRQCWRLRAARSTRSATLSSPCTAAGTWCAAALPTSWPTSSTRRSPSCFSAHDLTPWQLFEPCTQLLQRALDTGEVPPQVLVPAITCLHFHILWELSRLPSTDVPQEQLQSLKTRVTSFCSLCQSCLSDVDAGVREQAFMVLSDLLLVFGPQLPRDGREALAPLVLLPDAGLQSQLAAFLMDHVFHHACSHEELSAMEDSENHIEELHQRRVLLAGFCKLIIYDVLELSAASDVFKHYAKVGGTQEACPAGPATAWGHQALSPPPQFYSDYGDIIKETLNCTRQIDRQQWARTLLLSLQQLMTELLLQQGPEIRAAEAFLEIRDLARRFSLLFSLQQLRNRPALLSMHKEGIQFAFQEPPGPGPGLPPLNLPFLEVLSEFSPRLLRPDKALLLAYLEKIYQEQRWLAPQDVPWPSLVTYRNSLQPQEERGSVNSHSTAPRPPPGSAAKRPRIDAPSEHPDSSPWPSSRLPSPALTSTVLRGGPRPPLTRPPARDPGSDPGLLQSSSLSHRRSGVNRLSLMVEEEEEEMMIEEESSEEDTPEQDRTLLAPEDQLRDLFDSTILGIEDPSTHRTSERGTPAAQSSSVPVYCCYKPKSRGAWLPGPCCLVMVNK